MTIASHWQLAHGRTLELGASALVMGVLNVTPDSFSDGGRFAGLDEVLGEARAMLAAGASILDIGGESTRPGADPVSAQEEQRRIIPVIEALAASTDAVISIDTYRASTARLAVSAGAHIVNDVWGLQREPDIAKVAAETGAGLVVMHTGRDRDKLSDVIEDQRFFLNRSLSIARGHGVHDGHIVLDPGFGFAKDAGENLELMARFAELRGLWPRWLIGTSRKRFIGHVTGRGEAHARDAGTAATSVALRLQGAQLFRVHDVAANVDALAVADAMLHLGLAAERRPEAARHED
jgi:dihydropteroate synthase